MLWLELDLHVHLCHTSYVACPPMSHIIHCMSTYVTHHTLHVHLCHTSYIACPPMSHIIHCMSTYVTHHTWYHRVYPMGQPSVQVTVKPITSIATADVLRTPSSEGPTSSLAERTTDSDHTAAEDQGAYTDTEPSHGVIFFQNHCSNIYRKYRICSFYCDHPTPSPSFQASFCISGIMTICCHCSCRVSLQTCCHSTLLTLGCLW